MRGIRHQKVGLQFFIGITPAHAGNTFDVCVAGSYGRDHPRACGEYVVPDVC